FPVGPLPPPGVGQPAPAGARLTLHGSPHALPNGRSVFLAGRLTGRGRANNVVVMFQGTVAPPPHHRARGWRPAGWTVTDANGAFKDAYRFRNTTRRVTYLLRAFVPVHVHPLRISASQAIKVLV